MILYFSLDKKKIKFDLQNKLAQGKMKRKHYNIEHYIFDFR